MRTRISNIYERIQASYWFIPSIMAIQAMALSTMMLYADLLNARIGWLNLSWINLTGAAGGRNILSTVANSMITVTGVIFSITIVCLSLTAQQYGPRLLQNFLRDRGNQAVLGTVTATYLYCLLVLRTINESPADGFTPHLSILCGLTLAVVCVAVLIYFIHNITTSIQVTNLIANVSKDLSVTVERLFPEKTSRSINLQEGELALADVLPEGFFDEAKPVTSDSAGYLQAIDNDGLLALAADRDLVLRIRPRIGHFLVPEDGLVEVFPGEAAGDDDLCRKINQHFITGRQRTQSQDIEFLINELVEIAGRALSPGINDPFTAISCVDHLVLALCDLAQRVFPESGLKDRDNRIRIVMTPPSYQRIVGLAYNQLRQYGRSHAAVTIHLLEGIKRIMPFTRLQEQRDALLYQAGMIDRGTRSGLPEVEDRKEAHKRYLEIFQTLEEHFGITGEVT
ncbi:MAG TPA: DUF2254 domain-containing protein [Desulfuromonadales bacterium]|nr:DUF2254 domain-containing protein [Desulfuromonadales bacterium]